ncbi:hypothetical protein Lepto7376_1342 [[Leptolyngbya] sp. PCC 7376]|uniref:hypothetical protein n=1 Tax=[Leptolyngbya] sp. PCC 7376 TaxID=111781 RepID=UPI00029F3388|nr:hypothetical protein [[Leptolyngbya] sp. PCC 7376]AFY37694.1 hypothetical protein Lepto7376_1342 [[Leptolyngbya] sp. PCC 7376]
MDELILLRLYKDFSGFIALESRLTPFLLCYLTDMKRDTNWQSIGIGLVTITIIGLVIWALFHEIGKAPWQFITILIALLGALITFAGNLQIQIRNEQKPQKTEIYDQVINFFFDSILASKLGREPKSEDELVQGFANMTPDLILWASDDVLKLYIEFRQIASNNISMSPNNLILLFGQLLLAMRKDLGHQNNKIDKISILGTFVNDVENLAK